MTQDCFQIASLRGVATDPDSRRLALAAAMIRVRALAIARHAPELREEALEIVDQSRRLFRSLPSRQAIAGVVAAHADRIADAGSQQARARLVDALWDLFHEGQDRLTAMNG